MNTVNIIPSSLSIVNILEFMICLKSTHQAEKWCKKLPTQFAPRVDAKSNHGLQIIIESVST